jgi:hypothetical protein
LDTTNRYDHPHRRLPIALFNAAGRTLARLGVEASLEPDDLIRAATRKTGLTDFGDAPFREALEVLTRSLREEARLTPLGRLIQRGRLVGALATRLRSEALCRAHPEIIDIPLGPVIVIAGLQRTGTTLLHRLLAADPRMRSLASWEALNPLPLAKEKPDDPSGRISQARMAERGLAYMAPEFFAIHPVEHDAPEEDVLLLDISFMSQAPEAMLHVPSYAAWLESQDNAPAYRYLRKLMQLLSWQRPAKSWVLKSPHHMEYLDTLIEVFPEAHVVQTHRDPRKTMPSFCSMVCHGQGVFSDHVDPIEVSAHWVRKVKRLMERSIEVRDQLGEERFIDVSYYDLTKDPVTQLERIQSFAGLDFTPEVEAAVRERMTRTVQHKYGKHVYDPADFGLSDEKIEEAFRFYRDRYAIPIE